MKRCREKAVICKPSREAWTRSLTNLGYTWIFKFYLHAWLRAYRICLQCRRPRFDPWVRKIPWRREWHPTPVFLPGESDGQGSLTGYSPWDRKELNTTEPLTLSQTKSDP